MRPSLLIVLSAIAFASASSAGECSDSCSNEFIDNCMPFHCKHGSSTAAQAYAACRSELDKGVGPLGSKCVADCSDTPAMKAASTSSTCAGGTPTPGPPTPAGSGGDCTKAVTDKPATPTVCTSANMGCCQCGTGDVTTYVFWLPGTKIQRCIHTYNLGKSSNGPKPVLLSVNGYSQGMIDPKTQEAGKYYGYAVLGIGSTTHDGAGGFGLEFPNDGVVNNTIPTPCSKTREVAFLDAVFAFIEARSDALDTARVYAEGHSQNSMFSGYIAICYADKMAGVYQSSSGLAKTGFTPVVPGFQAQCALSEFLKDGGSCCSTDSEFCRECAYWPVYPRTCKNKITLCSSTYTTDPISCGTDYYMWNAMVAEGNDARMLSFAPSTGVKGGHTPPQNPYSWITGCLGMATACTTACATSFAACVKTASGSAPYEKFASCETKLGEGGLIGCKAGCAPTLDMLQLSEQPVVSLSQGKFGTNNGLNATKTATKPLCTNPFGSYYNGDVHSQCKAPSGWSPEDPAKVAPCPK